MLHEAVKSEAALGRHVRCLPQDPVGARHGRHPPSLLLPCGVRLPLFPEVNAGQCASGFYSSRGDQEGTYGVCTLKGPLRSCSIRFEQDHGVNSNAIREISLFKDAQHPNMVSTATLLSSSPSLHGGRCQHQHQGLGCLSSLLYGWIGWCVLFFLSLLPCRLQEEVHTCTMRSAYADSSRRPELQIYRHIHVVKADANKKNDLILFGLFINCLLLFPNISSVWP